MESLEEIIKRQEDELCELDIEGCYDYIHIENGNAEVVWLNSDVPSGLYEHGFFESVTIELTKENRQDFEEASSMVEACCVEGRPHYLSDIGTEFADKVIDGIKNRYYQCVDDAREYLLSLPKEQWDD